MNPIQRLLLLPAVLCLCCLWLHVSAQEIPLLNAFAHNDYQHKHPLFEALDNGYTNIEADVYIHKGRLVVTHVLPSIHHHRTLEGLYLQPLADHLQQNSGEMYPNYGGTFTLMIDIKSDAAKTYELLKPLLEKYRDCLSGYQDGVWHNGPVRIVLSGHQPYQQLLADPDRLAFIDEDLTKLHPDTTQNICSMASCKYSKLLKWKGSGLIPTREQDRLRNYVAQAHRSGAKVRLWGSPDNQAVWKQLLACGVDLINTDKLVRLKDFLLSKGSE
ncbi:MAG: phosphatidylinositol-specific phospholipase C/glycerophosphodiester phosphodiesterase family protein [Bacteroidota bacterium]